MSVKSALRDLNNAILDLQAADYNTYDRPLTRIAAALKATELASIVDELKSKVDFDAFLASADKGGSMMGSASLNWPTDRVQELGLAISLIERGASDPNWFLNIAHHYYYSGRKIVGDIRKITTSVVVPFGRDFADYVEEALPQVPVGTADPTDFNRIFIVHGHDEAPRETVARFVSTLGFEPVILHEQANRGLTIPEKLVANSNVGFAIVLLTPDDVGRSKDASEDLPRARQNVILELGYFMGSLGRGRVCALLKGEVEIPSDYMGVVYTRYDQNGGWRMELGRELQAAGYEFDWNRVMR